MSDSVKIFFTFNGEQKEVEGKKDEFMFSVYTRYVKMIGQEIEKVFFLYNGDLINPEKNLKDICENKNEIKMLVYEFDIDDKQEEILKQSKDIICPICNEICLINFENSLACQIYSDAVVLSVVYCIPVKSDLVILRVVLDTGYCRISLTLWLRLRLSA